MNILGIETSCDDTGIAILKIEGPCFPPQNIQILVNLVSSQVEIHRPWGGIVPGLAKREHQKNLIPVLEKALAQIDQLQPGKLVLNSVKKEKIKSLFLQNTEWELAFLNFIQHHRPPKIDFLAVTQGPGLAPALWTGVNFAQALSLSWDIPLIPVNHLEAHAWSPWLSQDKFRPKLTFPVIALLVSGGHTQLILIRKFGNYQILGETRDDAAGECFDKTARVLGLGYPGGPPIAQAAQKWQTMLEHQKEKISPLIQSIKLPRPMIYAKNFDFSFSGLKTAVVYLDKKIPRQSKSSPAYQAKMAHEIQASINDVLVKKTIKAGQAYQAQGIILGGGVSANQQLRQRLLKQCQNNNFVFFRPTPSFAMDNAAMIALTGYCHQDRAIPPNKIPSLKAEAALPLT